MFDSTSRRPAVLMCTSVHVMLVSRLRRRVSRRTRNLFNSMMLAQGASGPRHNPGTTLFLNDVCLDISSNCRSFCACTVGITLSPSCISNYFCTALCTYACPYMPALMLGGFGSGLLLQIDYLDLKPHAHPAILHDVWKCFTAIELSSLHLVR